MSALTQDHQYDQLLDAGQRALHSGNWSEAEDHFRKAVERIETPQALEGLGMAAWWLDDVDLLFSSRERSFRLYRSREDHPGAARMAIWLALDNYIFRYRPAVANGWLRRGERILQSIAPPTFEHCFLAFTRGHLALEENDSASARRHAIDASELARKIDLIDFEMLANALQGLALVSDGHVNDGMGLLDEAVAAALSGELSDPDAIVTSCCYLFYACERVRDYRRAAEWCDTLTALCARWSYRSMVSVCRAHYAGVLIWQGDWSEAERELTVSIEELLAGRAGWASEGLVRLADLRRRQGRFDEALSLFDQAPHHILSLLGRAEIAFDNGDLAVARDLADRFIRRISPGEFTSLVIGLELKVRICIAAGDLDEAGGVLANLEAAAERLRTAPMRAQLLYSRGLLARARHDHASARAALEDAVDLFEANNAPFDVARSRLELATVLATSGRRETAIAECRAARDVFERLGAEFELQRARDVLEILSPTSSTAATDDRPLPGLTPRESQVLRLIARGYTNPEIAEMLYLSVRTVERHVSTGYRKIGASGKAARAIAAAFVFKHSGKDDRVEQIDAG